MNSVNRNVMEVHKDPGHEVAVIWEADSETSDPESQSLIDWANQVLEHQQAVVCELAIKVVGESESQQLNLNYRGKDSATNVLSFPLDAGTSSGEAESILLLGDLAVCAPVVRAEAKQQNKSVEAHFAHMVVHGVLHLLGFDHQLDAEAEEMEQIERDILHTLGFDDPYQDLRVENS